MYSFLNCTSTNSLISFFSFLNIRYTLFFLGIKSFLRFITWSQGFLTSILFDSTFSNTLSHLWNLYGTIFLTFSLSSLTSSSNFFSINIFYLSLSDFPIALILLFTFLLFSISFFTTILCYDMAKQLSHYLYFFSFSFYLIRKSIDIQEGITQKRYVGLYK